MCGSFGTCVRHHLNGKESVWTVGIYSLKCGPSDIELFPPSTTEEKTAIPMVGGDCFIHVIHTPRIDGVRIRRWDSAALLGVNCHAGDDGSQITSCTFKRLPVNEDSCDDSSDHGTHDAAYKAENDGNRFLHIMLV